ncbi:MAG: lamin tail domain-containing protein [Lentimicrobiaceae bacterium]|nr:lamin tail domain-containing protein [Lentimicrobiaceae bacterium]
MKTIKTTLLIRILILLCMPLMAGNLLAQNAWINEIHYDNVGADVGEFIEVIIENPSSYTLAEFRVHLYNGSGNAMYSTESLSVFTVGATVGNFTIYYYVYPANGLQNGAPDGMALSYQNVLIPGQWLSYEGTMTGADGPAQGLLSVDIGVFEDGTTPIGHSLQLSGAGTQYGQFTWQPPATATMGSLNNNQTLGTFIPDPEPTNHATGFTAAATGVTITLNWTDAVGTQLPDGYLILASTNAAIAPPVDGVPVIDDIKLKDGSGAKNITPGAQTFTFTDLNGSTPYYFAIYPYTNSGQYIDYKTSPAAPQAGAVTAFVIEAIDFNNLSFGNWDTISLASDKNWYIDFFQGDTFAKITGFQGNEPSNDWIISPPLNLGGFVNTHLSFITAKNYTGPDLEVLISTNYSGTGSPASATWSPLSATLSAGNWTWTQSGNISLAGYSGVGYIAFRYTSTAAEAATWELDNVVISGTPAGLAPIVINEILVDNVAAYLDPSDQNYDPWIELYNPGSNAVSLLNWSMTDNHTGMNRWYFPDTTLAPGAYLIVWADQDTLDAGLHANFLPNKAGEEVYLYNAAGAVVDSVIYGQQATDTTWARIPNGFGIFQFAKPTPMAFNSLFPVIVVDTTPPVVLNAAALTAQTIRVVFNEAVGSSATNAANYTGIGTGHTAILSATMDTVTLNLGTPLVSGQVYFLTIAGVADTAGNVMAAAQTFPVSFGPANAQLVITEIMYNPPETGTDSLEYIEIYNKGTNVVNLNGFFFAEGVTYTFPAILIQPSAFVVVAKSASAMQAVFGLTGVLQWTDGSLSNSGENIALHDNYNNLVDAVYYLDVAPWPTQPDGNGPSLVLCDPSLNNDDPLSWRVSVEFGGVNAAGDTLFGTPGGPCISSGIQDPDQMQWSWNIYPNPASGDVYFTLPRGQWKALFSDLSGRMVIESDILANGQAVSVSHLETGIYLITLENDRGERSAVRKLVLK